MKKVIVAIILILLMTGMISACAQPVIEVDNETTTAVTFPLEEKITLTAFVHTRDGLTDFVNNEFTKWLEEQTNVHLEFILVEESEADEQLSLLLLNNEYPDLIFSRTFGRPEQALYGSRGDIIPLNDFIETYGVYSKPILEEYKVVKDLFTMPDGNIYSLPEINDCYHCQATQKLWVYQPWLDTLGLELPNTTEDFHQMLVAFRDDDPNGNGLQDEIPFAGAIDSWDAEVEGFVMNAFIYNATDLSGTKSLYVDDAKIKASYMQDEWKEGLKYLQMLRIEGLLDERSFGQNDASLRELGENPEVNILGVAPGGFMGTFTEIGGDSGRWEEWVTIPPLEGPKGVRTTKYNPYLGASGASITNTCEYPEIAFMLADFFYSPEATKRNTIGRPGIEWVYASEGSIGINGEQALWTELIPFSSLEDNITWSQQGPTYRNSESRLGREVSEDNKLEVLLYEETKEKYAPYYPDSDVPIPPLNMTKEQSSKLLSYKKSIDKIVEDKIAYFILSDVNIDAEWQAYLEEMEEFGIYEMLTIYQEAYDMQ